MTAVEAAAPAALGQTLADLVSWRVTLGADAAPSRVEGLFDEDPELPGIILMQGRVVFATLSRRAFTAFLSRPYARDIYMRRPLAAMVEALDHAPLTLAANTPIHVAAEAALARAAGRKFEPLLSADGEDVRLIEVEALLRAQALELGRALRERESTLSQLSAAQSQLVQAETMAALGQLVAGVAHEINTPVGVALTAASSLRDETLRVVALVEAGTAKRSDVTRYLAHADEATDLMLGNCANAAELIQSFKRVAVDQSSGQWLRFRVADYLHEIAASLKPTLRRGGHALTIECPHDLEIDSFPGAFSQVVTNLIVNSTVHAWPDGTPGRIKIKIKSGRRGRDEIELDYRDNGRGIPVEHRAKIFDPFFTTKRGQGGSGLGLHIVHNLVVATLLGKITYAEAPGGGARFLVTLRRIIPKPS